MVFRDESDPAQDAGAPVWRDAVPLEASGIPDLVSVFDGDPGGQQMARLEEACAGLEQRIGR